MASIIAVKVDGRGEVRDGHKRSDTTVVAKCDLCDAVVDAVASISPAGDGAFACKVCLRQRLEAVTVAMYELREPGNTGLPWGKLSG